MSTFDLSGRCALVTGGARGLGAGMAAAFTAAGTRVMIADVLKDDGELGPDRQRVRHRPPGRSDRGAVPAPVLPERSASRSASRTGAHADDVGDGVHRPTKMGQLPHVGSQRPS